MYVGAGTCGLGAGAKETLAAVHEYLDGREIKADVVMVGCIGLCSFEPLVDVQLPGRNRVCFQANHGRSGGAAARRGFGRQDRRKSGHRPIPQRAAGTVARRPFPGRTSLFRPANSLGAGQLRTDRSRADRGVHRPGRLPGVGESAPRRFARTRSATWSSGAVCGAAAAADSPPAKNGSSPGRPKETRNI